MTNCTCGTPDGSGEHLENCEVYLRYWEIDLLERIRLQREQIILCDRRLNECTDDLISKVIEFTVSVSTEVSLPDPKGIVRHYLRRGARDANMSGLNTRRI